MDRPRGERLGRPGHAQAADRGRGQELGLGRVEVARVDEHDVLLGHGPQPDPLGDGAVRAAHQLPHRESAEVAGRGRLRRLHVAGTVEPTRSPAPARRAAARRRRRGTWCSRRRAPRGPGPSAPRRRRPRPRPRRSRPSAPTARPPGDRERWCDRARAEVRGRAGARRGGTERRSRSPVHAAERGHAGPPRSCVGGFRTWHPGVRNPPDLCTAAPDAS